MKRPLSVFAVAVVSVAMAVSTNGVADASSAAPTAGEPSVQSAEVADEGNVAARVNRWISIKAFNKGRTAYARGHVGPRNTYRRKLVIIQSKPCKKCKWKFHGKTRTSGKSNYQRVIRLPRTGKHYFFRARLPKSRVTSKALEVWWT